MAQRFWPSNSGFEKRKSNAKSDGGGGELIESLWEERSMLDGGEELPTDGPAFVDAVNAITSIWYASQLREILEEFVGDVVGNEIRQEPAVLEGNWDVFAGGISTCFEIGRHTRRAEGTEHAVVVATMDFH